jgi:hypothetical protein
LAGYEGVPMINFYYLQFQLMLRKTGDGFSMTCETDRFGKIMWEEKYTEDGAVFVSIGKDK